ncbi:MAG: leucine-rich repeat protein, partial [Paludibacteraceae bacterium]|nr:leucine-rich repeat protein [Paludibacteraceae bacterium]
MSSYTGSSTEVTIPATVVYSGTTYTVTRIGKEAFKNSGITEITIPATVTTIGASAFAGCDLETIVFEGETPPVLETEKVKQWWDFLRWFEEEVGAFDSDDDMTVIVPEGCEEAYAGASGWSSYIEHITTDYSDTEWIGAKTNDWTDKRNWTSGVPTKYKNAIIHKVGDRVTYKNKTVTVSYYPIIAGQKYGSGTSYNNTAICNNIAFAPGAGVLGLHKLTYKGAVIKCEFEYDRWYAMT